MPRRSRRARSSRTASGRPGGGRTSRGPSGAPPPRRGRWPATFAAPLGSPLGRVEDVADLDRVGGWRGLRRLEVDLRHLALRAGAGDVGDDLGRQLVVDDVAGEDRPVLGQVDLVVLDLGLVGVVDGLGTISDARPIRKMPSVPSTTAVGVLAGAAKTAVRKASSVWLSSAASQPRSPACGAVAVSVDTVLATSSQALPPWMSLSAASALALASAFCAAVGSTAPASVTGATSIIQTWRVSGVVASSCSLASTSARRRADAFLRRERRLELGVDDALERDRRDVVLLVGDGRLGRASPVPRSGARRRTAVRTRRSDSSSRQPSIVARSRSSSLLIDWPLTLPTEAR